VSASRKWRSVVALSGGVGGARFLRGLAQALAPDSLTAIVNTGDDFEHWGLYISPDVDTVMYTLAGLCHEEQGWGLAGESFAALEMMRRYEADAWFRLGDGDLATHLLRTQAMRRGESLSDVTARLCRALGVRASILPMADAPCRTLIETRDQGTLGFQEWFVRRRAEPAVRRVLWEGDPPPAPGVLQAIRSAELVLIGPSNPYVSVDPILTRPGVRAALEQVPVVAVSPIVAGQAVKGPLSRMLLDITGRAASAGAVVRHYGGLLAGVVVERGDEASIEGGARVLSTSTLMRSAADSLRLAENALTFASELVR